MSTDDQAEAIVPRQRRYPILDEAPPHYGLLDETTHAGILDEGRP